MAESSEALCHLKVPSLQIKRTGVELDKGSYGKVFEVDYNGKLWCLRYNICIAWILDIRISTCLLCMHVPQQVAIFEDNTYPVAIASTKSY